MTQPLTGFRGDVSALQAYLFEKNDEKGLTLFGLVLKSMVKEMEYKERALESIVKEMGCGDLKR